MVITLQKDVCKTHANFCYENMNFYQVSIDFFSSIISSMMLTEMDAWDLLRVKVWFLKYEPRILFQDTTFVLLNA